MSAVPREIPATVRHYVAEGDVARVDLMEKCGAYIEFFNPGDPFHGWAYFQEAERPWRAGFQLGNGYPTVQSFDDMREAIDWVVSRMPK